MNTDHQARPTSTAGGLIAIIVAAALIAAGCAGTPVAPAGAAQARAELARLQSDSTLAPLAAETIRDAEAAVVAAEQPERDQAVASHRVYIATRRVEIARAVAEARRAEGQRKELVADRDRARLEGRTLEADVAKNEAATARREADAARMAAEDLQRQLNAKPTDRGMVLTLGDVLFETGRAELKTGAISNLDKLADFLNKNAERTVIIEGHTDDVGSADSNLGLSQRRADSVRSYLQRQGVNATRLTAQGLGEGVPVAPNESAGGRQQNRRVEIIVSNPPTAAAR